MITIKVNAEHCARATEAYGKDWAEHNGEIETSTYCPVAQAFSELLHVEVLVGSNWVEYFDGTERKIISLPELVEDTIDQFDNTGYILPFEFEVEL